MRFISTIKKSRWWWIPVVLLLAGINWLASQYHARIDFTAEKRFTLSAATKKYCATWMRKYRWMFF